MGKEICFHKIGPITMPKRIGYTISMICFICTCRRQDDFRQDDFFNTHKCIPILNTLQNALKYGPNKTKLTFLMALSILHWQYEMSLVMRKPVFDHGRLELAWSATEASKSHEIANTETRAILLSRQRTTKALIRLRGCIWHKQVFFSWCGWNIARPCWGKM